MEGIVVRKDSLCYIVSEITTKKRYECILAGRLKYYKKKDALLDTRVFLQIKVGDHVKFDLNVDKYIINDLFERKNTLVRPDVSNIDLVLLVFSAVEPDFSFLLLDKLLINCKVINSSAALIITKIDLISKSNLDELKEKLNYYESNNLLNKILYIDNNLFDSVQDLDYLINQKIVVLCGQTGVGKSTIINNLGIGLQVTNSISKFLGRGKHTTRNTELFDFLGGYLIDSPGFSAINIYFNSLNDIINTYSDFKKFSDLCKFLDCRHDSSKAYCGVIEAYNNKLILKERYENYLSIIKEKISYDSQGKNFNSAIHLK
ncbi:MAG: ribosome small subunit-dependent GTPase A [Acholeplasmatales bacterium]|jgi:ribosome biogenesis GTPase|nr:ribosome small subunit-dependent GTPase A [Acholeplasmatales bacterium]